MSKGWVKAPLVISQGKPYEADKSVFEIVSGLFENADGSRENRIGVSWRIGSTSYPPFGGFALPSRREEIEQLINILSSNLPEK